MIRNFFLVKTFLVSLCHYVLRYNYGCSKLLVREQFAAHHYFVIDKLLDVEVIHRYNISDYFNDVLWKGFGVQNCLLPIIETIRKAWDNHEVFDAVRSKLSISRTFGSKTKCLWLWWNFIKREYLISEKLYENYKSRFMI